ncbi:MAG: transposase, partial [Loktanella sp.]|nr:transposase [Loktanella sp.]
MFGIRSETRLCEEVHLNLAYRWFCRLGLEGAVPDRSTFSKNRHGRFAEGDVLRRVFEMVVAACAKAGLIGGSGALVDGSTVHADANRDRRASPDEIRDIWQAKETVSGPVQAFSPISTWCDCGGRSPEANEVRYIGLMDISREENDHEELCRTRCVSERGFDLR